MGNYDDIINLPHHQSATRPHMSNYDRAAQFAPFQALTGLDRAMDQTAVRKEGEMETEIDKEVDWESIFLQSEDEF